MIMIVKVAQKPYGLVEFYEAVAREMGYADTSELRYDCTRIDIAENIQDGFYDYYTASVKEKGSNMSDSEIQTGITMLLAMSGPKVNHDLKANEVEVFSGFIIAE